MSFGATRAERHAELSERVHARLANEEAAKLLSERELKVLSLYYHLTKPMTLRAIAKRFKCSNERIQHIRHAALLKLWFGDATAPAYNDLFPKGGHLRT